MIIDPVTITIGRADLERLIASAEYYAQELRKKSAGRTTRLALQRWDHSYLIEASASAALTAIKQYDTNNL